MIWMLFAFIAAFSWATADLISKICMNRMGVGEYQTLYARFALSVPFLAVPLLLQRHGVSPMFWVMCLLVVPGDVLASTLYIKALKSSPISVVVPLMSFAPVFMLVSSPVLLGEWPSALGILGVLLVTSGAYMLNLDRAREHLLTPLKLIFTEKGPRFVVAAAAIFSVDTAFGKKAVQFSDPVFFSFFYSLFMALAYTPFAARDVNSREKIFSFLKSPYMWGIGACFAAGVVSFLYAIRLSNIAYVSAVGKISMVIAIVYGRVFFQEEKLRQRLAGVFFMLVGIFLIFRGS